MKAFKKFLKIQKIAPANKKWHLKIYIGQLWEDIVHMAINLLYDLKIFMFVG